MKNGSIEFENKFFEVNETTIILTVIVLIFILFLKMRIIGKLLFIPNTAKDM